MKHEAWRFWWEPGYFHQVWREKEQSSAHAHKGESASRQLTVLEPVGAPEKTHKKEKKSKKD